MSEFKLDGNSLGGLMVIFYERLEHDSAEQKPRNIELLAQRLANFASYYGKGRTINVELRLGLNFVELRGEVQDVPLETDAINWLPPPQKLPKREQG